MRSSTRRPARRWESRSPSTSWWRRSSPTWRRSAKQRGVSSTGSAMAIDEGVEPADEALGDGEALLRRHRHGGHDRGRPDPRRLRLHEGVPGRAHDARREDHADLRGHAGDPANRDRPRDGARGAIARSSPGSASRSPWPRGLPPCARASSPGSPRALRTSRRRRASDARARRPPSPRGWTPKRLARIARSDRAFIGPIPGSASRRRSRSSPLSASSQTRSARPP